MSKKQKAKVASELNAKNCEENSPVEFLSSSSGSDCNGINYLYINDFQIIIL